jgi:hypothetical protein
MPIFAQIGDQPLGDFVDFFKEAGQKALTALSEEGKKFGQQLLTQAGQAVVGALAPGGGAAPAAAAATTTATPPTTTTAPGARPVTVALPPGAPATTALPPATTACYFEVAGMRHACTRDGWLGALAHAHALAARGQVPVFVLAINGERISMRRCVMPTGQVVAPSAVAQQCPSGMALVRDSAGRAVCMPLSTAAAQGACVSGQVRVVDPSTRALICATTVPTPAGASCPQGFAFVRDRFGRAVCMQLAQPVSTAPAPASRGPAVAAAHRRTPAARGRSRRRGVSGIGDWYEQQQRYVQNALARYGVGPAIPPWMQARQPKGAAVPAYASHLRAGTPRAYPYHPALPADSYPIQTSIATAMSAYGGRGPTMRADILMRLPPRGAPGHYPASLGGIFR